MSITREQAISVITYLGNNLSFEHDNPLFDEWHQISGEDSAAFYLETFEVFQTMGMDYAYNHAIEVIYMRALTWGDVLPGKYVLPMGEEIRAAFNNAAPKDVINYLYPDAGSATASSLINAIALGKIEAYSLAMSIGLAHIVSDKPSADGLISVSLLFETGYTPTTPELTSLFSTTNKPVIEQHQGSDKLWDVATISGNSSDFKLSVSDSKVAVISKDGKQQLFYSHYERIQFDDNVIAFDIEGNAGKVYRLYKAAFDRTPDKAGLGFWIGALDKGASLESLALGFVVSDEFKAVNGQNPTNLEFVSSLYQHILGRLPDQAGLDFWASELDTNGLNKSQVLFSFSESSENKIALTGQVANGIEYVAS